MGVLLMKVGASVTVDTEKAELQNALPAPVFTAKSGPHALPIPETRKKQANKQTNKMERGRLSPG